MESIPAYITITAMGTGVAGGVLLWIRASRKIYQRHIEKVGTESKCAKRIVKVGGAIGTIAAIFPAFFLSWTVGGNVGGGFGEIAGNYIGIGMLGVPIGLGIGIALVYFVIQLFGTSLGLLLGRGVVSVGCSSGAS